MNTFPLEDIIVLLNYLKQNKSDTQYSFSKDVIFMGNEEESIYILLLLLLLQRNIKIFS